MSLLGEAHPRSSETTFAVEVANAAADLGHEQPTIDFALAAVARVLRLPPGSPLTLFARGRTIGWIGHAIEQYATEKSIRPRAKYVGIAPAIEMRRGG
jgi:citrate synthase